MHSPLSRIMKLPIVLCALLAVTRPASSSAIQTFALGDGANSSTVSATTTVAPAPAPAEANRQSNSSASAQHSARLMAKPSAPYTLEDLRQRPSEAGENLILRLTALNESLPSSGPEWSLSELGQRFMRPSGANSTSLDLRGLLDTLDRHNLTSEVHFDDSSPGSVNITISSAESQAGRAANRASGHDESRYSALFNVSSVMKDNHRFMGRNPSRSRVSTPAAEGGMTAPPIQRTADVVAENYTARKVAEEANIFALKLLNQLNLERLGDENIINSPFCIYQSLALLMAGAMGDTSRELDRLLLSAHSAYENTKLTHDQDRARLVASFGEAVRQLQSSSTNHFRAASAPSMNCTLSAERGSQAELDCSVHATEERAEPEPGPASRARYQGGSERQHFIVANNLLFAPGSFEVSAEFRQTLGAYHNNTALTKMEVGSTESVQVVNEWVRRATVGLIPAVMSKRQPFDEFNVLTLLGTSWLSQQWLNSFERVASSLRSGVRLKGQTRTGRAAQFAGFGGADRPLMEFVDDQRVSHFVEYIRSEPTRQILNYHSVLNKQKVDVVVVPFEASNQRLVAITPLQQPAAGGRPDALLAAAGLSSKSGLNQTESGRSDADLLGALNGPSVEQPVVSDPSALTRMMAALVADPRRAMRSLWTTIAPDLVTKQTLLNLQLARQKNSSLSGDESLTLKNFNIPPKTQLSMPLVRIRADATLTAPLNHIGLVNAFDPAQANFIGINGHPFNYNKLHLSNVLYKTTFNLNEEGVNYDPTVRTLEPLRVVAQRKQLKARPAELELEKGELVNEVSLNRPFVFMVVDIKTKLVLYVGAVRNPAKENSSL